LFKGDFDHAAYVEGLEGLERNPADVALAWQHGLSSAVTDEAHRSRELKNWIERLVLPTRAKRGRG
jgi:GMP synthase (glutamine-hydrolysing)